MILRSAFVLTLRIGLAFLLVVAWSCTLQAQSSSSLRGTVTDPSGASIADAQIYISGAGIDRETRSGTEGRYAFEGLRPAKYRVRALAAGFSAQDRTDVQVDSFRTLDFQLVIAPLTLVENIQEDSNTVNTEITSNGDALVLREKELTALSDDPDELRQQLLAMAGPAVGPDGGQIFIDGFTGGNLPPKSSIREVRINSNPFSPEYDRPGFGRIEVFTKPGTDYIRGQAFMQYNKEALNSRNPLLEQSTRPPYQQQFYGFNISGPIIKQKMSFGVDAERRTVDQSAFIIATGLDSNLDAQTVNQAVTAPQTRTNFTPRLDYAIDNKNTLVLRYQNTRSELDQQGVGGFSLASRAYNQQNGENTLQLTETHIINPRAINESRFQYMHSVSNRIGDNTVPGINVQGAFEGGGSQVGNSGSATNQWEITNATSYAWRSHTTKFGGRVRQVFLDDTSVNNFGGTFSFFGGQGPALDSQSRAIAGTSIQLSALEVYRRTLLFNSQGLAASVIRALGGGASLFTISGGTPTASVQRVDMGLFATDDWRIRPNVTLSYGVRYETQTNIRDSLDWSPRVSLAWGLDGGNNKQPKTVLRGGFGVFYDRLSESDSLKAARFNGTTQQSYVVQNPDFYPAVPSLSTLLNSAQAQQLQSIDSQFVAPRLYQSSIGVDRQINRYARFGLRYVYSRGVHQERISNVNAPVNGIYPYGDREVRLVTQSNGFSRSNQLILTPNVNYKKIFLFGFYGLSSGRDDYEGLSADPNNLRAEWGPSTMADVRHRAVIGTNVPLPFKFNISPFMMASSGAPYNITTGRDVYGDGNTNQRPALVSGLDASACKGAALIYASGLGCYNLNPVAGTSIRRNSARGPANFSLNVRLARSWSFGGKREQDRNPIGLPGGGPPGGGPPPGGGAGLGGGPGGGGPGGGPPGMFGGSGGGRRYGLQLSVSANNVLNHPSYATPSGDLSSPYFGQYRSLASMGPGGTASTYNRKIDVQLRLTF